VRTALSILNGQGITATMDAATMGHWLDAFTQLDHAGELTAWIVGCMAAREFVDPGVAEWSCSIPRPGAAAATFARTSSRLYWTESDDPHLDVLGSPTYRHQGTKAATTGIPSIPTSSCWSCSNRQSPRGLGAKLHATADGTVAPSTRCNRRRSVNGTATTRYFTLLTPEFVHQTT